MIVITGASDGLGHEIAKLYKASGKTVVNISRGECSVADHNLVYDLSKGDQIAAAVQAVLALDEPLEVLINCVGIWSEEPIGQMTEQVTQQVLDVNAKAPMMVIAGLMERIRQDGTDILNVVSTAGLKGNKNHAAYVASKWAERGFTDSVREELHDTPSRVIGFYPGGMKTKLFAKDLGKDITDNGTYWMDPAAVAVCVKQILDLPKGIEVSEITLNRKKGFKG
ncbi:MAG: hypothetical protein QG553_516 [Patescibacteria group bacterium]|nr:hypothetical protein [Patescibacteria group bacterium]